MFETIFRQSPDPTIIVEPASAIILNANGALRHVLGYDPELLPGKSLDVLWGPDSQGEGAHLIERVADHAGVCEERRMLRVDGSVCPMRIRAGLAKCDEQSVVIITLHDVTQQKRSEGALRAAEAKYRSIFEHTAEGIFQTTLSGRYISANPALARIYGYDTPEQLMDNLIDIATQLYVDPGRRVEFRCILEENGVVQGFESRIYRRDGRIAWISENARAVYARDGTVRYYEGTVTDITQRKRAEEEQRREATVSAVLARVGRELLTSIASPQLVDRLCKTTTAALECERTELFCWDAAQGAYVLASEFGTGSGPRAPTVPRINGDAAAGLVARLERDEVVVVYTADGASLPLAGTPPPGCRRALYFGFRRAEVSVGILAVAYRTRPDDFTEHHERIARSIGDLAAFALEQQRLMHELDHANRLKSEFVATMSHELRTPLNIIIGYNELLLDNAYDPLTEAQRKVLCATGRNAAQLAELINATLDLSRLEAGRLPFEPRAVDARVLLEELQAEVEDFIEKPGVEVRWELEDDLPIVRTDPPKLKLVVKNLLTNAVKFTERGRVTVQGRGVSDGIELSVADSGIGIAAQDMPIIFEAFRQVDSSMTRRHGGVGLGLYISRALLEMLRGHIQVESVVGVGSTFRVWLPLR